MKSKYSPVPKAPQTKAGGRRPYQPVQLRELQSGREGQRQKIIAATALLLCMLLGAVAAREVMDITWIEAFYFAVTTITTVGYGDINPAQLLNRSKSSRVQTAFMIFHMCYIIAGVSLIGVTLSMLVGSELHAAGRTRSVRQALLQSSAAFLALVGIGTAGMCWIEGFSVLQGTYWAVITLSTVGYGHLVPTSPRGQLFATFFMLAAISAEAYLFAGLAMLPVHAYRRQMEQRVLGQYGDELHEDQLWELAAGEQARELGLSQSDAFVTRDEFTLMMLVRLELILPDDLSRCQEAFDKLNILKTGRLDVQDLKAWNARRAVGKMTRTLELDS